MITSIAEFNAANDSPNTTRLVLGVDIGVNANVEVKPGKVLVPNGWRFVRGALMAFTAAAQGTSSAETTLTVGDNSAIEVGEFVRVRMSLTFYTTQSPQAVLHS